MSDEVNIELRAADIDLQPFIPNDPLTHKPKAGLYGLRAKHGPTGVVGEGIANTPMKARHFALAELKERAQEYAEKQAAKKSGEATLAERVKELEHRVTTVEGGLDALTKAYG